MAGMARHLRAVLALQELEAFPRTHALPAVFFEEYGAALAEYDRYIAHVIAAGGLEVSCAAGCSACCRHELARGMTPLEIIAIYRFVHGWPDIDAVYDCAGRNAVAFQRLLHARMQQEPGPMVADDPRVLSAHLAYNRLERPCPFLDLERGTCRIYPVRPLVCRWFHNLSPAQWCEPSHPEHARRDAFGVYPDPEINELMAAISRRLGVTTLNYLAGAFVHVAGDVMQGRPIVEC
jgi:Fe-S-cluster containining protein